MLLLVNMQPQQNIPLYHFKSFFTPFLKKLQLHLYNPPFFGYKNIPIRLKAYIN